MNERQRAITDLLDGNEVSTQLQLQRLLARQGHEVTQATISRDLDRLGVVRVRRNGRLVYALSEDSAPVADPVGGDGVEEVVTQLHAGGDVLRGSELQQRLKGLQGLHGTREADRPRRDGVPHEWHIDLHKQKSAREIGEEGRGGTRRSS